MRLGWLLGLLLCGAALALEQPVPELHPRNRSKAWQEPPPELARRFRELAVTHALRVRESGDARQAMLAALMLNPAPDDAPEYTDNDALVRRLAGVDDAFVAWLIATKCPATPAACEPRRDLQHFLDVDPDNAIGWLRAARMADDRGDDAQARTLLARAARSARYDDYRREMLVESRRFHDGIAYDEGDAGAYSDGIGVEVVRHRHASGMHYFAKEIDQGFAGLLCGTQQEALDDALRADCISVHRLVADSEASRFGLFRLLALTRETPEHAVYAERYLDALWLDAQRVVTRLAWGDESRVRAYYEDVATIGEDAALVELLRSFGRPTQRPEAWWPERLGREERGALGIPEPVATKK